MRLLLDEGVPARAAMLLRQRGIDASHVVELAMAGVADQDILARAVADEAIVVTLDSDFHQLLALSQATQPSVIRIRLEGLSYVSMADRITQVVEATRDDLAKGVAVSVDARSIRVHDLPLQG